MTREEAIERIKNHKIIHKMNEPRAIYISEALDIAIKALEQEPCEDAVSRQVVKEQMNKYGFHAPDMTVTEFVEDLPPVTPQMKIGHWILQPSNKDQGERDFIWWKCSECGQVIFSENDRDRREFHAFCGRCGAINERELVEPQERENKE